MAEPTVLMADVHGNLEALEAALASVPSNSDIVCLGDMVGYGPDPGPCLQRLADRDARMILGNHDAAVLGRIPLEWFNPMARDAAEWTRGQLDDRWIQRLEGLEETVTVPGITGVHGTPEDPLMEYLMNAPRAENAARRVSTPILGVAHTHTPAFYRPENGGYRAVSLEPGRSYEYRTEGPAAVVNPGSVGQPRDGDPRACYLEVKADPPTLRWKRVEYPVSTTQRKIREAGLPPFLAQRLARGQ